MPHEKLFTSLQDFADQLTAKFSAMAAGEPEDQLKPPVDNLFTAYGKIISRNIVLKRRIRSQRSLWDARTLQHTATRFLSFMLSSRLQAKVRNPKLLKDMIEPCGKALKYIVRFQQSNGRIRVWRTGGKMHPA